MGPEKKWQNELPDSEYDDLLVKLTEARDRLKEYITKSRGQRGAFDHRVPEADRANNLLHQVNSHIGNLMAKIPLNRTENTRIGNLFQEIDIFFSSIN